MATQTTQRRAPARLAGAAFRHHQGWALALALAAGSAAASPPLGHPLANPAQSAAAAAPATKPAKARTIAWDEMIPPDWDPLKDFKDINLGMMADGDPRATALLKRMREVWDQAPVNNALDGAQVRIPGYVVPLEEGKAGVTEFLLVPYFGACIHTPPPPANQIIHVREAKAKGLRSMDTVWVTGRMEVFRGDSFMGVSGYRMQAPTVETYVEKKGR